MALVQLPSTAAPALARTRHHPDRRPELLSPRQTNEVSMTTTTLATPTLTRRAVRRPWAVAALLCLIALGLGIAFPGHALDLVAFTGITGPLTSALTAIASLGPGIKALVGFVGFVVALISLAALRNFGPVLFYVGLAIFAAVGLVIAGAIMGAVV
tara:strand:+ start:6180 stop:6647 length:468 start_codon:yes stop_codon:yes gene_type:complete